ncbi:MAG: polysaccharide deacetylase family protein [Odoribacter sp.]|nr:polysaccharide deacetylase family protein [Odoribacter sp.]
MNILTFDTEEWYIEKAFKGDRKEKYKQFDEVLDWILEKLDWYNLKATFFCVGGLAVYFPDVVKRIVSHGHEIGSHSDQHQWINKMTQKQFEEDCCRSIGGLEELIGMKVKSFRAPAFSIGQNNLWAFEVLAKNGIEYDCSVFPTNRDFGGFPQFRSSVPSIIDYNGITIKEFPICPAKIMNCSLAFSGGGYFRLIPLMLQEKFVRDMDYVMFYFHINDLIEQKIKFMSRSEFEDYFKETGTLKNRVSRYIKSNIGKGGAKKKLESLFANYQFVNLTLADSMLDWNKQPVVKL